MMVETQTLSLPYCKVQLNFFAAGLEKGENWALECKKLDRLRLKHP